MALHLVRPSAALLLLLLATLTPPLCSPLERRRVAAQAQQLLRSLKSKSMSAPIVNGQAASDQKSDFVFQVAILKDGEFRCGGSIITPSFILSAGHCFTERNTFGVRTVRTHHHLKLNNYHVGYGSMNRTELRTVRLLEVWIPRDYVYLDTQTPGGRIFRLSSDLAIAKLAEPLAFSDNVAAIPLSGDESHLRHGSDLTASGWGSILGSGDLAPGHLPQQLQFVTLDHLSDVCDRMYNNDQYTLLGNSSTWYSRREMLCAGCEMGGSGTCNGDSGGPLNIRSSGGCPVQVGVTSFGNHERDVCDVTTFPSVFARVSHLLPWIEHVVGQPVRSTVVPQPTTHCENCLGNDNPAGRECEQAQEYGMHKCVVQSLLASSFILTKPRCNKEGKHRLMAYINFHRGFQNAPEVVKNRMKQGFVFFLRSDQGPGNGILRIPSSYFCHGDRTRCPQSEELINTPLTNPQLLPASGNGYGVAHPAKVRFNKDKGGWLHWSPGCSPQHTYAALYVLVSKESGHPVYLQISLPVGRVPPP